MDREYADGEVTEEGLIFRQTPMLVWQSQPELEWFAFGGSAHIFPVDRDMVLKAPQINEDPDVPESQHLHNFESAEERPAAWEWYQDQIEEGYLAIQPEKEAFSKIKPHPNIVRAIAFHLPEGIYLERHMSMNARLRVARPPVNTRLLWYADIAHALGHLHRAGLAHIDLRLANVLCDAHDHAILCDLGSTTPLGEPNLWAKLDLPDQVETNPNGLSLHLTEMTDCFALGSVMFEIETGRKPAIWRISNKTWTPTVDTGIPAIDSIIERAWHSEFEDTPHMIRAIEVICGTDFRRTIAPDTQDMLHRLLEWRQQRIDKHGCVLVGEFQEVKRWDPSALVWQACSWTPYAVDSEESRKFVKRLESCCHG